MSHREPLNIHLGYAWQVAREVIDAMAVGRGERVERIRDTYRIHFSKLLPAEGCPPEIFHEVTHIEAEFLACESVAFMVEKDRQYLLARNMIEVCHKIEGLYEEQQRRDAANDALEAIRHRVNEAIDGFGEDSP